MYEYGRTKIRYRTNGSNSSSGSGVQNDFYSHNNTVFHIGSTCTNCGLTGHSYRYCTSPVNSYGIIAYRVMNPQWTLERGLHAARSVNGMETSGGLEFILVRRKESLRFVEFVRGKYDTRDPVYIKQMLSKMTREEREFLRTTTFDDMWQRVWGSASARNYRADFEYSKARFDILKTPDSETGVEPLQLYLDETDSEWTTPEWGFPKGRRNPKESDLACAIREFEEETGLSRDKVNVVQNMEPICETYYGDNHVHYCQKYYLAQVDGGAELEMLNDHPHMPREIGDIGWFNLEQALATIRAESVEKREVLLRASAILRSFTPSSM
jgi:8-oxo-dGTP pyrophosphatase MutT (NUDIX family)